MVIDIFREPTEEEKKDMIILGTTTMDEYFRKRLEAKETEYFSKRKPFCSRCAKMDYTDRKEATIKEIERKAGYVQFEKVEKEIKIQIPKIDLDQYGKEDRFEMIKESPAVEPASRIVSGEKVMRIVQTGINRDFKCKVRGCGITLNINNEDLDKVKEK